MKLLGFLRPKKVTVSGLSFVPIKRNTNLLHKLFADIDTPRCYVAGGFARYCVTPLPEENFSGDIDVFFENIESWRAAMVHLGNLREYHSSNPAASRFLWNDAYDLHIIEPRKSDKILTGGPCAELLPTFDFSVCAFAITSDVRAYHVSGAMNCEKAKELVLQRVENPFRAFSRAMKYAAKGYSMNLTTVRRLFDEYSDRKFTCELQALTEGHTPVVESLDVSFADWLQAEPIE